ncbi:hypothetical protein M670_03179 [Schinkia azotoformans MEV2011]|uniref:Lipoprotein n=2 Tax=Schinkia azotoformans TaxID=1454 RepID=A0A072NL38_SCHAZ|nr:hypothetical protein [Schinkia azotoformans]KEF37598.1 hypothetical protein M670_03179 [Schinkia azotoformans MEV2011]MEC1695323.1 hypothetical protein [Schinkia azotoformans]MEC1724653.1 hypothetical protein [Schinkia azotoformans]MEC1771117.1 hypothetical protein [Schinkia azotoformans]MEC1777991.1 hypothetical protein [Schinkia azotoformans]
MKNSLIFLLIIFLLTGCMLQKEKELNTVTFNTEKDTYTISAPLNLEYMNKMREETKNQSGGDPFQNINSLDKKGTRINLDISFLKLENQSLALAEGNILFNGESIKLLSEGVLIEFTAPDTKKKYYYADLRDKETNYDFIVIFSLEDKRAYIQSPMVVPLGEFNGYLVFGESFVDKAYWDAIDESMQKVLSN